MSSSTSGPTANDRHLQDAVNDSHYLLAYFTRARVTTPPDKLAEFGDAVKTISSFGISDSTSARPRTESAVGDRSDPATVIPSDPERIAAFWNAFIFLSGLAYPATVESIRYYFRFYYDGGKRSDKSKGKHKGRRFGQGLLFQRAHSSFGILTSIALFMTVGLSLLSYIGSTALLSYDADYSHWTQVQTLVRYLDEGGKPSLTTGQTANYGRLALTLPIDSLTAQSTSRAQAARSMSPNATSIATDGAPPSLEIPIAQVSRISNLLVDADLNDNPPTSFQYACIPILKLFAAARGAKLTDPVPAGALTLDDCLRLMAAVKPHVLTVADDLAFTFSSMSAERTTLCTVLAIVMFPVRAFDIAVLRPVTWAYHGLVESVGDGIQEAQAAQMVPKPVVQTTGVPSQIMEFAPSPSDVFNLLVLLQQRHAPIPINLPLPSVKTLGDVFDARAAVAITNTYLLTLAFGFLGACVRVLREIHNRLQDFTLAPSLFARYQARILLGMVAGPTIGLFFSQDGHLLSLSTSSTNLPSLSTQLPAVAIAFVAGFSIEILFAILDRFIKIFQDFAGVSATPQSVVK
jgi:hypothetical protein